MNILEIGTNIIVNFFNIFDYTWLLWSFYDNNLPYHLLGFLDFPLSMLEGVNIFCENVCVFFMLFNKLVLFLAGLIEVIGYLNLSTTSLNSLCISIKFLLCIAFLIFARGGIPRFRFDYLTKLGWIRFLSLVLLSILIEILLLSMI
jgi:NADH:ubiquinone oxidoreductase subunit H